jgi:outer membrane immunogenic protein
MKRTFLTPIVLTLTGSMLGASIQAGGMGPIGIAHNWTGFYLGANAGASWGSYSAPVWVETLLIGNSTIGPSMQYFNEHVSSFSGGGQLGYNYQAVSNWIIGAEFNFNGGQLSATHYVTAAELLPESRFVVDDSYAATNNWHTSLVARIGYAWNKWMLYATGGVAAANARVAAHFIATPDPSDPFIIYPQAFGNDNEIMVGGTGGIGLAYALSPHLNISVEGRYTNYGSQKYNLTTVPVATINGINSFYYQPAFAKLSMTTTEALVKINYQFA